MRILAVTGSSGGHIYPAVAFLEAMAERGHRLMLVVPGKHTKINCALPIRTGFVSISAFSKNPLKFARWALNMLGGSIQSFLFFVSFRPALVVGFGSLNTVPMVLLARVFGAKTMLHEQNVIFGRANKLLLASADRVAVSFNESIEQQKNHKVKFVLTGNPLRKEMSVIAPDAARKFFGFSQDKPVILVVGGSQGSVSVNRFFLDACALINKDDFQVCHLCGSAMAEELEHKYGLLNIHAKVMPFLDQMNYAYSAADLVVSRAGALALSEIARFGLSAIVIPYPYAKKHQSSNAGVFGSCGRAEVIEEEDLTAEILARAIEKMLGDPKKMKPDPSAYAGHFFPDAASRLADEAINLIASAKK